MVAELKSKYKVKLFFDEAIGFNVIFDILSATFPGVLSLEDIE